MKLNERIEKVANRSRAFYQAEDPGHLMVRLNVPAELPEIPPYYSFDLQREYPAFLDAHLAVMRCNWEAKAGIDDDTIPNFYPRFGIAEHSAWLGAEVTLQEDTSLPIPLIKSPEDIEKVTVSEENPWFQLMKKSYEYIQSIKDDTFVVGVRGTMCPMDIVNALRGDELFFDVVLNPELVHKMMRIVTDAVPWYYNHLCKWSDKVAGGYVYMFMDNWMGPNYIAHLSNDAAFLCSPETYDEFAFPYEKEILEQYDGTLYHVHNEKMQFVPKVATLPNVSIIEVSTDPNTVTPIDDLPNILAKTGTSNLLLHGTSDQVRNRIGELTDRNFFLNVNCQDKQDAEDIVKLIRATSKPLG